MIKKYLINFWIWWYFYQARSLLGSVVYFLSHTLNVLNVMPMAANLFTPMFQDTSLTGKFLSFFMRLFWIFFGSIIQIFITIPLIALWLLWLVLPLLPIIQIVRFIA